MCASGTGVGWEGKALSNFQNDVRPGQAIERLDFCPEFLKRPGVGRRQFYYRYITHEDSG